MPSRVLSLFVVLCLASAPAFAQLPGPGARAQSQPIETDPRLGPIFTRGVEALLGQRFDESLAIFEDLYRQSPRPTLLYYLGKVALAQQRYVAAADLYRRFLKGSGDDVDGDTKLEVQQFLSATITAECEVTVQGETSGLLLADGRIAGVLPLEQPLLLSPGTHRLTLEKGRRKVETQFTLASRRRAEVRFTLVPPLALLTLTPGVLLIMQMEPRGLEATMAPLLQTAMQGALQQQNAVLISPETQADLLQRSPELSGCLNQTTCQEKLGQAASAQFVLHLQVQSEARPGQLEGSGGGFRFTAKLLDVDVGLVSVQATQSCANCNVKRALGQLSETVQELLRQAAARPRGALVVESDPPGALVQFDGHTLGTTPYHREAFVGPHEVYISKAGYSSHTANVVITDADPVRLSVTLPVSTPIQSGNRGRRIAKWALLGTGVALTIIGGTLIGLNGRQSCPAGQTVMCPTFDGRSSGIPLLVLGLGSLGASGALFLLDRPASPASPATSTTVGSGTGAALLGLGF